MWTEEQRAQLENKSMLFLNSTMELIDRLNSRRTTLGLAVAVAARTVGVAVSDQPDHQLTKDLKLLAWAIDFADTAMMLAFDTWIRTGSHAEEYRTDHSDKVTEAALAKMRERLPQTLTDAQEFIK